MRIIGLIFIFLPFQFVYLGAQKIDLPKGCGFILFDKPKNEIKVKELSLRKYNYKELTDISKWTYNLTMSSINLYSGRDSSLHYFNLAFKLKPKATCRVMLGTKEMFDSDIENVARKDWYLIDLPDFDEDIFLKECSIYLDFKEVERDTSNLEKRIRSNEEQERLKNDINWEIQNLFDEKNRNLLDSLYETHGSFKPFTKYEQDEFSMVLHHSEDCEWTLKWFGIWMEEMKKGNVQGGNVLGPAFERMLRPETGFCVEKMPIESEELLERLKNEYPKEYGERLGYNNF